MNFSRWLSLFIDIIDNNSNCQKEKGCNNRIYIQVKGKDKAADNGKDRSIRINRDPEPPFDIWHCPAEFK
jgi:hypothetical protein